MTREKFEEIMGQDIPYVLREDDKVFLGLQIIHKYFQRNCIEGADHDIIYSISVDKLIEAGITEEDAIQLRTSGWMIQDDIMACFV